MNLAKHPVLCTVVPEAVAHMILTERLAEQAETAAVAKVGTGDRPEHRAQPTWAAVEAAVRDTQKAAALAVRG